MEINRKEVRRYLGYGGREADEQINGRIEQAIDMLCSQAVPRWTYEVYPLERLEIDTLCFAGMTVQSGSLSKNLEGCQKVALMAATLGIQVDRLIQKHNHSQVSMAVILQAASAAMIEEVCDMVQEEIKLQMEKEGYYDRPRFSPGYGDFSIAYQKQILQILNCSKKNWADVDGKPHAGAFQVCYRSHWI